MYKHNELKFKEIIARSNRKAYERQAEKSNL